MDEKIKVIRVRGVDSGSGPGVFWIFGALFTMGLLGKAIAATLIFWPMELGNFIKALLP